MDLYLKTLEQRKIAPNFYVSRAYLTACEATEHVRDGFVWLEDGGTDICLFPPLPLTDTAKQSPVRFVWSDFYQGPPTPDLFEAWRATFLDWEYLHDPWEYVTMDGGRWAVLRKNVRKWPNRNPGYIYTQEEPSLDDVDVLLSEWLEKRGDGVEDAETIVKYFYEELPEVRKRYLYKANGDLVAINVWDWNYMYVNYRFCLVKDGEPFLDEFARRKFFVAPEILNAQNRRMINDGGSLGNPGLERFKDKLNPIRKREVYSWTLTKMKREEIG